MGRKKLAALLPDAALEQIEATWGPQIQPALSETHLGATQETKALKYWGGCSPLVGDQKMGWYGHPSIMVVGQVEDKGSNKPRYSYGTYGGTGLVSKRPGAHRFHGARRDCS